MTPATLRDIDTRTAAAAYLATGFKIVPLEPGRKWPRDAGWQDRSFTVDSVKPDDNLGLLCTSNTDVDIDCLLALKCANEFLPRTTRIHGRPGKPRSHHWFEGQLASEQFKDIDQAYDSQAMLVEIRSGKGHQTVVPPSMWTGKDRQETLAWEDGSVIGPPAAKVDPAFLRLCIVHLATTALIARHWPKVGIRRELRLAYARFLLDTLKLDEHTATRILEWACRLGGSDENGIKHAARAVRDTKAALDKDEKAIGGATITKLIPNGDKLLERLREWYGVAADRQRVELIRAADVQVVKLEWLWYARLARGAITLVEGGPEKGKSTILIDLAARVSRGHSFPGEDVGREPGNVVLMIAEDDLQTTVVPRFMAAGADLDRIYFLGVTKDEHGDVVPFHLSDDHERLRAKCQEVHAVFVIVDPLVSFLGSRKGRILNTNNDLEVRKALGPLKELAEQLRASVAAIRHYRKGNGTDAMEAGGGSVGFSALVRVIIAALPDPDADDDGHYLLAVAKNNLIQKKKRPAYAYEIVPWQDDPDIGCIRWGGTVDMSAGEILVAQSEANKDKKDTKAAEAKTFLEEFLASGEWVPTVEILQTAKETLGLSEITIRRARAELPIKAEKQGKPWFWRLAPPEM